MHHDAQLRICHERIGDDPTIEPGHRFSDRTRQPKVAKWAWCDLPAFAWCFDESLYVCEIHYVANHELHRTQLVSEE
jgi:hypothetical protein